MLVNLDKYLDKLPNVNKNAAISLQYSRDNISNGTGKAYSINNGVGPAEVLGSEPSWGPYIRWDLYKKIGSPAINTYDDYLSVLKKMQDLESKTADGKKTYGITLWKDWDNYSLFLATELGGTNGIDCGDQLGQLPFLQVDFKNGKTKNILDADSSYINALNFYFKANQMGLVDPDSLTQTWDTAKSKLTEGRVFFSWWSWYSDNYNTLERMNAETPTGFAAVLPKDTKTLIPCNNEIGKSWPFAISSATKNLDACLKLLDFMYSTDGVQLWTNGPQGTTWDLDTSGKPKITAAGWKYVKDLSLPLPQGDVFHNDGLMLGSCGLSTAFINPKTQEPINYKLWASTKKHEIANQTKLQQDWTKATGYQTTLDYVKAKNMVMEIPLAQSLIPSMTDDISASASRIGDIVKAYSWNMIFAKNDAEFQSLYKEMKTKAEGLGLKDVYDWSVKGWTKALDEAKKYK
jgi:putative aldouronate transport system substrate-binding protein